MLFNPNLCTGCGRCDSCFLGDVPVYVSFGFRSHLQDNVLQLLPLTPLPLSLCLPLSLDRHGGSHCRSAPGPVHHQGERHQCEQGEPRQRYRSCHRVQEVQTADTGEGEGEELFQPEGVFRVSYCTFL